MINDDRVSFGYSQGKMIMEQKYNDMAVDLIQEALGSKHKGK